MPDPIPQLLPVPHLPADEVHVWSVSLAPPPPAELAPLETLLSHDERDRAARFHFAPDRDAFVVGRATLRILLGRYLDLPPAPLVFEYGAQGKPALARLADDLQFNLAHSAGMALIAVARGRALGIDLERIRPDLAAEGIAERFFSHRELEILNSLPRGTREPAFFACWTRKEAYVKARGGGLALPLDAFDVEFAPGRPATLLATRPGPLEATYWSMFDLDAGPGFAAALVVEGTGCAPTRFDWRT